MQLRWQLRSDATGAAPLRLTSSLRRRHLDALSFLFSSRSKLSFLFFIYHNAFLVLVCPCRRCFRVCCVCSSGGARSNASGSRARGCIARTSAALRSAPVQAHSARSDNMCAFAGNPSSQYPSAAALVTVLEQAASDLSSDINAVAPDVASLVGVSHAMHTLLRIRRLNALSGNVRRRARGSR